MADRGIVPVYTVAAEWASFWEDCRSGGTPEDDCDDLKVAFYAGFLAMRMMGRKLGAELSHEGGKFAMDMLLVECKEFFGVADKQE